MEIETRIQASSVEKDRGSHLRLFLASQSPRRLEILRQIGFQPEVIVSGIQEHTEETAPERVVMDLSRQKAENVASRLALDASLKGEGLPSDVEKPAVVVLGADTVVCAGGRILGKPHTHEEAEKMIRLLSGRVHQVLSGVTLIELSSGRRLTFAEKTDVEVAPMTSKEIHSYAFSSEPMDKAGGYGIQGLFGRYITGISGDYTNVVGLPASAVYRNLKTLLES
ncbi:MAG: Maf family protein [Porcincola intestinalis]|nr:Maf family protein [Porcincola intestinalis]MDY5579357.1 Maf family protein [Porcincola intestinalis]